MDGSVAIAAIVVYVDIHCYINLQQMVWGGCPYGIVPPSQHLLQEKVTGYYNQVCVRT